MSRVLKSKTYAIVLHFRNYEVTSECLTSLVDQDIDGVVVLDNSEDRGASMKSLIYRLNDFDCQRIVLVSSLVNQGFAAGVNYAVSVAIDLGAIDVLLVNSDVKLCDGALNAFINCKSNSRITCPNVYENGRWGAPIRYYHKYTGLNFKRAVWGAFPYVSGCCLYVRRVSEVCPLFSEEFYFYGEDVYLSYKLLMLGSPIGVCIDAEVVHKGSASSVGGSYFYEYQTVISTFLLNNLVCGKVLSRVTLLLKLKILFLRAIWRGMKFKSVLPLRAYWAALSRLKRQAV